MRFSTRMCSPISNGEVVCSTTAAASSQTTMSRQQAAHRDGEARWPEKNGRAYFGYKNHVNADVAHAPCHVIGQTAHGELKSGSSNCSYESTLQSASTSANRSPMLRCASTGCRSDTRGSTL